MKTALPGATDRIEHAIKRAREAYLAYAAFLEERRAAEIERRLRRRQAALRVLAPRKLLFDRKTPTRFSLEEKRYSTRPLKQLDETAKRIDPKAKNWFEVDAQVRRTTRPRPILIPSYEREVKRARQFLVDKDAVPFPQGDDCEVIETPPFQRSTIDRRVRSAAAVRPGDEGLLLRHAGRSRRSRRAKQEEMLRENDHGDQVDTAVHEAYPGHHLQLSFARTNPSLIRKVDVELAADSLFAEGWGLYSEELMNELGYYTRRRAPDAARMDARARGAHRHRRRPPHAGHEVRRRGEDPDRPGAPREDARGVSEVKRYTMSPTQPLSYLVGRETIFRMRERYKEREGADYTLSRLPRRVLSHGTIPVGLIEREMFGD